MNLFTISYKYLLARLQNTLLNIIMMAAGVMLITILILASFQIQQRLTADSKNIDAVIGAKGSPLQLVLSTIWHVDIPTGNIDLKLANKISKHPQIKWTIPLALGDNYRSFRIIGSDKKYLKHFNAKFNIGQIWQHPMEVVLGAKTAAETGLKIGDKFYGSHGLVAGGELHANEAYWVVGILEETNTVLDRLIITSLESVWDIHSHDHEEHEQHHDGYEHHDDHEEHNQHHDSHEHHDDHEEHNHHHDSHEHHDEHEEHNHHHDNHEHHDEHRHANEEITALLIGYKNRLAALSLPRFINQQTSLQAASPAFEITRLIKLIGVGKEGILIFGSFLIILALSSILIGLLNSVNQRRYDLAIFRTLGASRQKIFLLVIIEGMIVAFLASMLGLLLGHLALELIGNNTVKGAELGLTGLIFLPEIFRLWLIILFLCLVICVFPAFKAYKTDLQQMLSKA